MIKELNEEILKKLYLKEKKPLSEIAKMFGCSSTAVNNRCRKYGIKLRPQTCKRIHIDKSILKRLYVKEGKSLQEVAEIFSCSFHTVLNRCKEYGIPLRGKRIKGVTKPLLQKLYVEEGKTTREIAKMFGCSYNTVNNMCRKYGIKLRPQTYRRIHIDKSILKRLYVKEGKSLLEVAEILSCSLTKVYRSCKEYGIYLRGKRIKGVTKPLLQKLYVKEDKSPREVARTIGCSKELSRRFCKQFGIPIKKPEGRVLCAK